MNWSNLPFARPRTASMTLGGQMANDLDDRAPTLQAFTAGGEFDPSASPEFAQTMTRERLL
jgi:hypothetical protein